VCYPSSCNKRQCLCGLALQPSEFHATVMPGPMCSYTSPHTFQNQTKQLARAFVFATNTCVACLPACLPHTDACEHTRTNTLVAQAHDGTHTIAHAITRYQSPASHRGTRRRRWWRHAATAVPPPPHRRCAVQPGTVRRLAALSPGPLDLSSPEGLQAFVLQRVRYHTA
jgi:hypothetical protein